MSKRQVEPVDSDFDETFSFEGSPKDFKKMLKKSGKKFANIRIGTLRERLEKRITCLEELLSNLYEEQIKDSVILDEYPDTTCLNSHEVSARLRICSKYYSRRDQINILEEMLEDFQEHYRRVVK